MKTICNAVPVLAEPQNEASPKGPDSAGGEARESARATTEASAFTPENSRGGVANFL
jgi:hypothetical protein